MREGLHEGVRRRKRVRYLSARGLNPGTRAVGIHSKGNRSLSWHWRRVSWAVSRASIHVALARALKTSEASRTTAKVAGESGSNSLGEEDHEEGDGQGDGEDYGAAAGTIKDAVREALEACQRHLEQYGRTENIGHHNYDLLLTTLIRLSHISSPSQYRYDLAESRSLGCTSLGFGSKGFEEFEEFGVSLRRVVQSYILKCLNNVFDTVPNLRPFAFEHILLARVSAGALPSSLELSSYRQNYAQSRTDCDRCPEWHLYRHALEPQTLRERESPYTAPAPTHSTPNLSNGDRVICPAAQTRRENQRAYPHNTEDVGILSKSVLFHGARIFMSKTLLLCLWRVLRANAVDQLLTKPHGPRLRAQPTSIDQALNFVARFVRLQYPLFSSAPPFEPRSFMGKPSSGSAFEDSPDGSFTIGERELDLRKCRSAHLTSVAMAFLLQKIMGNLKPELHFPLLNIPSAFCVDDVVSLSRTTGSSNESEAAEDDSAVEDTDGGGVDIGHYSREGSEHRVESEVEVENQSEGGTANDDIQEEQEQRKIRELSRGALTEIIDFHELENNIEKFNAEVSYHLHSTKARDFAITELLFGRHFRPHEFVPLLQARQGQLSGNETLDSTKKRMSALPAFFLLKRRWRFLAEILGFGVHLPAVAWTTLLLWLLADPAFSAAPQKIAIKEDEAKIVDVSCVHTQLIRLSKTPASLISGADLTVHGERLEALPSLVLRVASHLSGFSLPSLVSASDSAEADHISKPDEEERCELETRSALAHHVGDLTMRLLAHLFSGYDGPSDTYNSVNVKWALRTGLDLLMY